MNLTAKERELIEYIRRMKKIGWEHQLVLRYSPLGETHVQQIIHPKPVSIQGVRETMLNLMQDLSGAEGVYLLSYEGGSMSLAQVVGS